jgi:hypothetical protein
VVLTFLPNKTASLVYTALESVVDGFRSVQIPAEIKRHKGYKNISVFETMSIAKFQAVITFTASKVSFKHILIYAANIVHS